MSSSYRRQPTAESVQEKFRSKASQLQELFPAWSNEDLVSLLTEVNGDIQLAATRISEGHAEQWGSVTRKKDKKPSSSNTESKERFSGRDQRGGRGGRGGGRGGSRGGTAGTRGAHRNANGHRALPPAAATTEQNSNPWSNTDTVNQVDASSSSITDEGGWGAPFTTKWVSDPIAPAESSTDTSASAAEASVWGADVHVNGSSIPSVSSQPVTPALAPTPLKAAKTPATSKLSWAQIARLQEKPAPMPATVPTPAPSLPRPTSPTISSEKAVPREFTPPPPEPELESLETQPGWEEPTTIQSPSWDDEPQLKPSTVQEAWLSASTSPAVEKPRDEVLSSDPKEAQALEKREPVLSALPAQIQQHEASRSSTPSTNGKRPSSAAHRSNARFKTTDQAVVMPNSTFATATDKIGMQFGSLSLAGDDILDSDEPPTSEPAARVAEHEALSESKRTSQSTQLSQPSQEPTPSESPAPTSAVSPPKAQTPLATSATSLFQQAIPQQGHQTNQHPPQHSLPSSISQPSMPSQSSSSSISSPISSSFSQSQAVSQPSLANHHPPQHHVAQQNQAPVHTQYMQHGLPTHLDPAQNQLQHSPHAPQAQQQLTNASAGHSSYFRQPEAPYFHTPTPPAGQQDSPYGTFGQIGQQMQHQSQGSHGGFNTDYGYNDSRNNFYDSYSGQAGFGNRTTLGHEELKGLTAPQQNHASTGLPPSSAPSSQQSSQTGAQPPPAGGQGPQQGYPHPVPYYFPFPQNQYYGSPYNSGYGVPQPFVKYPAMFQPGPGSAPSPVTKQAPNTVQHSNPYGQSLYGQQHPSNAYDDIGYQHHSQHGHGQNVGTGLPGSDYPKQLYGGHNGHGQGIQSFMSGLGQSAGGPASTGASTGGGPQGITQRSGGSPENAFKPYGPGKDIGVGVGQGVGQGGPQGRLGGAQQPAPGAGFYGAGAGRFGANVGAGAGAGPQVQQPQQHQPQGQGPQLGYPQGGSDGNSFYSYQRGQQYWQ